MGWVRHGWGLGKNNDSEYLRVGGGAGGMGTAIESIKKAKWGVGGAGRGRGMGWARQG
jgi:hypothetical protein